MSIDFNPVAPKGQQWTISDGLTVAKVSRLDAASALRASGLSIGEANQRLAEAKLRAASTAASV